MPVKTMRTMARWTGIFILMFLFTAALGCFAVSVIAGVFVLLYYAFIGGLYIFQQVDTTYPFTVLDNTPPHEFILLGVFVALLAYWRGKNDYRHALHAARVRIRQQLKARTKKANRDVDLSRANLDTATRQEIEEAKGEKIEVKKIEKKTEGGKEVMLYDRRKEGEKAKEPDLSEYKFYIGPLKRRDFVFHDHREGDRKTPTVTEYRKTVNGKPIKVQLWGDGDHRMTVGMREYKFVQASDMLKLLQEHDPMKKAA